MTDRPAKLLGFWSLLALGLNGVVGVGIFFLPARLGELTPGWAGVGVLGLTAAACLPVALTFAQLARRFDQDGGPAVYARAAFGDRAAFVVGWVAYLSAVASTAAVIAGLTRYSVAAWCGLGGLGERLAACLVALALFGLSAAGLVLSSRVWIFLTVAKLAPLVGLVGLAGAAVARSGAALGDAHGLAGGGAGAAVATATSAAVTGSTPASWAAAALAATFAFQGFEIVPVVAGHAERGDRAVPRATLGALLGAAVLYALLQAACVWAVPGLSGSKAPLVEAAGVLGGARWATALGAGTNVSSLGIAFGMAAMTPRYLAALSVELGAWLGRESSRGVPLGAVGVTAALVLALLGAGDLGELFALSSVAVLAQFGATALALAELGRRRQRGLTPAQAWPAPFALGAALALGWGGTRREWQVAAGAVIAGLVFRWFRSFK